MLTQTMKMMAVGTLLFANLASADVNLAGSHVGQTADNKTVELLAQPIAGRNGSFLGLLVMIDPKAVVYLIDPLDANSYAMVPVQVTSDGEIGVTDDNPSLVLNVSPTSAGSRVAFNIVDANSGNRVGFKGPIKFDGNGKPELTWLDLQSGSYTASGSDEGTVEISALGYENQANASMSLKALSGNYVIRKKLGTSGTGLFTLRAVSVRSTGAELETFPRKIGFFLRRKGFWSSKDLFLLVNPQNDEDIIILKKN